MNRRTINSECASNDIIGIILFMHREDASLFGWTTLRSSPHEDDKKNEKASRYENDGCERTVRNRIVCVTWRALNGRLSARRRGFTPEDAFFVRTVSYYYST